MPVIYRDEILLSADGKRRVALQTLRQNYACSGGTAAPAKHLTDTPPAGHGLPKGAPRTAKVTTIRTILEEARAAAEDNPRKRRRLNDQSGDPIDPDQLEVLYSSEHFWPTSRTTSILGFQILTRPIKKWIMRQYEDQQEKVKQRLQSAKSRIHISCDLWTSPNSLAILGVVGHYVTEDSQLEHHILAFKDMDSKHDGSHLAAAILEVVDDWGFASKLRYFVMDNAGNNDTTMRSLSLGILRRYDIQYDPKLHRLRCQGHIINLAAKAFLFVTDNEKLAIPSVLHWHHSITTRQAHNILAELYVLCLNLFNSGVSPTIEVGGKVSHSTNSNAFLNYSAEN